MIELQFESVTSVQSRRSQDEGRRKPARLPTPEPSRSESLATLVGRAQGGDQLAVADLLRKFRPTVHAIALERLHDEGESEEVAQQTLFRCLQKLGQLEDGRCFPGWLKRIALNLVAACRRRRRQTPTSLEEMTLVNRKWLRPLDEVIVKEDRTRVRMALAALSPQQRSTLLDFYFSDLSLKEMSEKHRAPVGTIKRRLHDARGRFAEVFRLAM